MVTTSSKHHMYVDMPYESRQMYSILICSFETDRGYFFLADNGFNFKNL